jgi:leucyl/phenylalanyl-tRNA--protein transferase
LCDEYESEFCASVRIDTEMVAACCRAGFLPMSESFTGHDVLLVKCHELRVAHYLREFHVSKSDRRHARDLEVSLDTDVAACLDAIVAYHPQRWLTEPLCDALLDLASTPRSGVRVHSVEIYRGPELVAGEIGYACGTVYTSMAGFHGLSGAGKVQLLCLGKLLARGRYSFWDLGMPMEYKGALGGREIERRDFLELYEACSHHDPKTPIDQLAPPGNRIRCADLLTDSASAPR